MYQSIGMYKRITEPSKVITIKIGDIVELFVEKNIVHKTAIVKINNNFIDTLIPIENRIFNKVWEKQTMKKLISIHMIMMKTKDHNIKNTLPVSVNTIVQ